MSELQMRRCSAVDGIVWIKQGWGYYRRAPMQWISLLAFYMLTFWVVNQLPLSLDLFLLEILGFTLTVAFMLGCRLLDMGQRVQISVVLQALQRCWLPILQVGVFGFLILLINRELLSLIGIDYGQSPEIVLNSIANIDPDQIWAIYLFVLLMVLKSALVYFAAPLAIGRDLSLMALIRHSVVACLKNWLPLLISNLLFGVFFLAGMFSVIGLLIVIPLGNMILFAAYQGIFEEPDQLKPEQDSHDVMSA